MFESKVVLLPQQIFSTLDSFYGSDIYMKMRSRMAGSRHLKSLSALGPYEAAPEPAAVLDPAGASDFQGVILEEPGLAQAPRVTLER